MAVPAREGGEQGVEKAGRWRIALPWLLIVMLILLSPLLYDLSQWLQHLLSKG